MCDYNVFGYKNTYIDRVLLALSVVRRKGRVNLFTYWV